MNETINDRIKIIISELFEGNASAFAREAKIKQPTLNTIIGERKSKPSYEILNAITLNLNINAEWLLTGKGEMLVTPESNSPLPEPQTSYLSPERLNYYEEEIRKLSAILAGQQKTIENLSETLRKLMGKN